MNWRLSCPVPVFLSMILTLGCNSSAKHVQMDEVTKGEELMVMLQASPEQPLGLEHPIIPPKHPSVVIRPESNIKFIIPIETLNPNTKSKILTVTPDPNIDYKLVAATPTPGIDYKMFIVPDQEQISHTAGKLEVPFMPGVPPVPQVPPKSWEPKNRRRDDAK